MYVCFALSVYIISVIKTIIYSVLLVPNSISKIQKWRVQFGNIRNSFLSKHEIISKLKESQIEINESNILPKRTKFSQDLSDLLYDESYVIQVIFYF